MNKKKLELYLHIPFCVRKCAYCDFLSFAAPERMYREYVDKLIEEIYGQSENFREYQVVSIFVGGGTPSLLPASLMEELFAVLHQCFNIEADAEITIEANPGTLTMEKLELYRQSGVNRLSLGLQSADDQELNYLGRIHTYEDFLKSYQRARQAGFTNINVDLMSALPGQDLHSWKTTLRKVLMLKPEHISAYSLIIEEGTPFYSRYGEGKNSCSCSQWDSQTIWTGRGLKGSPMSLWALPDLPDEEMDREMYHITKELMAAHGYHRYEISNYARSGCECLHNKGYWTGTEYLGLGLGASSYVNGCRFCNERDLGIYLGEKPGKRLDQEILTKKDMEEEFFYVGLRLVQGVSLKEFEERFGERAQDVYPGLMERLEKEGAAVLSDGRFRLTDYGMDVSNYVMAEFLQ